MKIQFVDNHGKKGYVEASDGTYKWNYEGDYDSILSALVGQLQYDYGHGRPDDAGSDDEVDELVERSAIERVRDARKRLYSNPKVSELE